MRDIADDEWEGVAPAVTIERWAMREPVAWWLTGTSTVLRYGPEGVQDHPKWSPLFAFPPDAAGDIESLKKHAINLRLDADECALENERLRARVDSLEDSLSNSVNAEWHNEEIERLTKALLSARTKLETLRTPENGLWMSAAASNAHDIINAALTGKRA